MLVRIISHSFASHNNGFAIKKVRFRQLSLKVILAVSVPMHVDKMDLTMGLETKITA